MFQLVETRAKGKRRSYFLARWDPRSHAGAALHPVGPSQIAEAAAVQAPIDAATPVDGPGNYSRLIDRRARMQGFVVFDYWERWAEAEQALLDWYRAGRLVNCEDVDDGLENMPDSLASLFTGANRGVKICRVAPDPEDIPAA